MLRTTVVPRSNSAAALPPPAQRPAIRTRTEALLNVCHCFHGHDPDAFFHYHLATITFQRNRILRDK